MLLITKREGKEEERGTMRHFRASKARNTKKLARAVVYVMACQSIVGNTMVANAAEVTIDNTSSTSYEASSGDNVAIKTSDKDISISGEAKSVSIVQEDGNNVDISANVADSVHVGSNNNEVTIHKDVCDGGSGDTLAVTGNNNTVTAEDDVNADLYIGGNNNTVTAEEDVNKSLAVTGNGNTVTAKEDVGSQLYVAGSNNNVTVEGNVNSDVGISLTGSNNNAHIGGDVNGDVYASGETNTLDIDGNVNRRNSTSKSDISGAGGGNISIHGNINGVNSSIGEGTVVVDGDATDFEIAGGTPDLFHIKGNVEGTVDLSSYSTDTTRHKFQVDGNVTSKEYTDYWGTHRGTFGLHSSNTDADIKGDLVTGSIVTGSGSENVSMHVGGDIDSSGTIQLYRGDYTIDGKLYYNDKYDTDKTQDGYLMIHNGYTATDVHNTVTVKNGIKDFDIHLDNSTLNVSGDIEHSDNKEKLGYMAQVTSLNSEVNLKDGEYNCRLIQVTPGHEDTTPGANAIYLTGADGNTITLKNYDINAEYNGLKGTLNSLYADEKSSITAENNAVTTTKDNTNIEFLGDIDAGKTAVTFTKGINFKSLGTVSGDENVFKKTDFSGDYNDSITVWQASGQKLIATDDTNVTDAQIQQAESNIQYVIKQSDVEHGTIEILPTIGTVSFKDSNGTDHEYRVALEDQVVRVKITPDTGYKIKSTGAGTCELTSLGNSLYELTVPRFGGVNISALMEAIIDDTKNNNNTGNNNTGSNNTGVDDNNTDNKNNEPILIPSIHQTPTLNIVGESGSDSYEYGPAHESYDDQHMWTTTMHGTFKETAQGKQFIGLDGVEVTGCVQIAEGNGKYNWYLFDDNGLMQTGWHTLRDGKWYYFYADGHMAKDEVTPDGYYVDNTGAYNEVEHIDLQ